MVGGVDLDGGVFGRRDVVCCWLGWNLFEMVSASGYFWGHRLVLENMNSRGFRSFV